VVKRPALIQANPCCVAQELRQSFAAATEGGSTRWFKMQIQGSEMGIVAKGDQGESAELGESPWSTACPEPRILNPKPQTLNPNS